MIEFYPSILFAKVVYGNRVVTRFRAYSRASCATPLFGGQPFAFCQFRATFFADLALN